MAQFMLDDAFKLFLPVLCQVFFIQLDIVGIQQIPASGRFQAAVEVSAVPERFFKVCERKLFCQLLQLLFVHCFGPPHF